MELTIPTRKIPVTVYTIDSKIFNGSLFLRLDAERHPGPEMVLDRMNEIENFFPLKLDKEGFVIIINKANVIMVDVSNEFIKDAAFIGVEGGFGKMEKVTTGLSNLKEFKGTINIQLPEEKARVLDFTNRLEENFFPVYSDDNVHIINRNHICYIRSTT